MVVLESIFILLVSSSPSIFVGVGVDDGVDDGGGGGGVEGWRMTGGGDGVVRLLMVMGVLTHFRNRFINM